MKPTLVLGFTDYFHPIDDFFMDVLSEDFEVVRDDNNPKYLIFCDETYGTNNLSFDPNNMKKIFFTGENRRPWNYRAHHAISFDHLDGPQFYRLPLYVVENWVNTTKLGWTDLRYFTRTMRAKDKTGFCSFVTRNGGCNERNDVFHRLNQYKTVDSGGPLFNNVGGPIEQDGLNSHITKIDFLKPRKFHLAYENSMSPGYVTEKLLHGFLGETIPIYWGSPTAALDFNPDAFINRHDFKTTDAMLKYIELVDNDDILYNSIISRPILSPYNKAMDLDNFRAWFRHNVYVG